MAGVMRNVEMQMKGNKLHIIVDMSKNCGPSKSNQSVIIASTGGNKDVPGAKDGEQIGLNIYKPNY